MRNNHCIHRRLVVEELEARIAPSGIWEEMGVGGASGGGISDNDGTSDMPSIAVGLGDNPIVAWQDSSYGVQEIYVLEWDGSSWQEMGTGSASGGGISNTGSNSWSPCIAVGGDGKPVVAWGDESDGDDEIYVLKWDGSSWSELGTGSASGGGISDNDGLSQSASVAVDGAGNPVVAWEDQSDGDWEIYVLRWNGSAWEEMGTGSASGGGISNNDDPSRFPSIVLDGDDNPVVAWQDSSDGDWEVYVRRWNGSSWEEVGTGSATGGGISDNSGDSQHPALAIDLDGGPVVAWEDLSSGNFEIYVREYDGGTWVEMGTDSASGGGISNNDGPSAVPSVVIGSDGKPIVVWQDGSDTEGDDQIYVRRWNGTYWAQMGSGSATDGGISETTTYSSVPSIAVDGDGSPIVAWSDAGPGNTEIYVRSFVLSDDDYEENDTRETAWYPGSNWEETWLQSLDGPGMQGDDDWFRIDVAEGVEQLIVDLRFTHDDGNIDLEIYDAGGGFVTSSNSETDNEYIAYSLADAGTYYLRVFGEDASNSYDLWWDSEAPPMPDLTDTVVSLDPEPYDWGESFDVNFVVANIGTDDAGAFSVGFYLSDDEIFDDGIDPYVTSVLVENLLASTDVSLTETLTLPESSPFAREKGEFFIVKVVDEQGQIDESDETNNTEFVPFFVGPRATITASVPSASEEGLADGEFTVERTGSTDTELTVYYIVEGTATSDEDYVALSGSVVIPEGSSDATITVTPLDDGAPEGTETVVVTLTSDTEYRVGSPSSATVEITDDDWVPVKVAEINNGQVMLYDTDATGLEDADVDTWDVLIKLNRDDAVNCVTIVGNPTGLGIVVHSSGDRPVRIVDSRRAGRGADLEQLSFVAYCSSGKYISLKSGLTGAAIGRLLVDEGLIADADLDGDGQGTDVTGIYCGGSIKWVKVLGGVAGDVVVKGTDGEYAVAKLDLRYGNVLGDVATPDGGLKWLNLYGGDLKGNILVNGRVKKMTLKALRGTGGSIDGQDVIVNGPLDVLSVREIINNSLVAATTIGAVSIRYNLSDSTLHAGGGFGAGYEWLPGHGNIASVIIRGNVERANITAGVWLGDNRQWDNALLPPDPDADIVCTLPGSSVITKVNVVGQVAVDDGRHGILAATSVSTVTALTAGISVKSAADLPWPSGVEYTTYNGFLIDYQGRWI